MKVKDSVYYYEIKMDFNKNEVTQKREEHKVIGVNKYNLVIDDLNFTSIRHTKMYRSDEKLFNSVLVFDHHFEPYWDYIQGYVYTSSSNFKVVYKRIKKAIEKFIYKKHGRYCNTINLLDQIQL